MIRDPTRWARLANVHVDPSAATRAREQALAAWEPLAAMMRPGRWFRSARYLDGPWPGAGPASVWGLSQPLAAAVALVRIGALDAATLGALAVVLEEYRMGNGYGPFPGDGTHYYDDNAWIGLDFVGVHLATGDPAPLVDATRVLAFLREGEHPDGGVHWVERRRSPRNTCSTAPTAQLALWVHLLTGDPEALAFAERCRSFLVARLRRDDHLHADNVDVDGTVDPAIYSYNQGTPVGMDVLFHRVTGDPSFLADASAAAGASLTHFAADDRLWTGAPCFNAIWLRNLATLDAVTPLPGFQPMVEAYAERLWEEGRDPGTGWFTRGGIGRYEKGGVLDQGGVVQILALAAWPPGLVGDLV